MSIARVLSYASRDFGGLFVEDAIKQLDKSRVQAMVKHIRANGGRITEPVKLDTRNKELRDGHHRVAAAVLMGLKTVPYELG